MSESMIIYSAYFLFTAVTIIACQIQPVFRAAVICYFAGWLLLPVAHYPPNTITLDYFTVNVIGAVLPSNLGLTKAVLIPVAALIGITLRMPRIWRDIRPTWADAAVIGLCIWPVFSTLIAHRSASTALFSSVYLFGAWGGSWMIGRLLFTGDTRSADLLKAIAWSGVILLPIAVVESAIGPTFYEPVYGKHAFFLEGAERYVGYRPLAFFEHGNQYGMWIALSAFSWWAIVRQQKTNDKMSLIFAIVTSGAALASQSIGAILLLLAGVSIALLPSKTRKSFSWAMMAFVLASGTVYFSGQLPVEHVARNTAFGQKAVDILRASGRGSIGYRVRRDQMALGMLKREPVAGYGIWDWWRPLGSHPWGLPLLLAGQFGLVALFLAYASLLYGAVRTFFGAATDKLPLAIIVILATADSLLNSYIFMPAIVASGALMMGKLSPAPTHV